MLDMTPDEAVDAVSAAAREVSAAYAAVVARVPGREAERVARTLEFEAAQLSEAVTVLRKWTRQLNDGDVLAPQQKRYVEDRYPPRPTDAAQDAP